MTNGEGLRRLVQKPSRCLNEVASVPAASSKASFSDPLKSLQNMRQSERITGTPYWHTAGKRR